MSMTRREFLHTLAVATAAGLPLAGTARAAAINDFYDLHQFGNNVTLMHFTDCHAQLMPSYFREPSVNLGVGDMTGRPPHLVGEALLKHYQISANTRLAHAFTHLDYVPAARTFGKVGGFAHLATLAKKIRAQRPGALLLDGGDSWQGSATALWTKGEDMVQAARLLGVDIMTGHWNSRSAPGASGNSSTSN
jgi:sulfur-oxidizing protein SoxB